MHTLLNVFKGMYTLLNVFKGMYTLLGMCLRACVRCLMCDEASRTAYVRDTCVFFAYIRIFSVNFFVEVLSKICTCQTHVYDLYTCMFPANISHMYTMHTGVCYRSLLQNMVSYIGLFCRIWSLYRSLLQCVRCTLVFHTYSLLIHMLVYIYVCIIYTRTHQHKCINIHELRIIGLLCRISSLE